MNRNECLPLALRRAEHRRQSLRRRHALRVKLDRLRDADRRRAFRHGLAVTLAAALIAGGLVFGLSLA